MKQKEKESYIQAMLYVAKIDGIKKKKNSGSSGNWQKN